MPPRKSRDKEVQPAQADHADDSPLHSEGENDPITFLPVSPLAERSYWNPVFKEKETDRGGDFAESSNMFRGMMEHLDLAFKEKNQTMQRLVESQAESSRRQEEIIKQCMEDMRRVFEEGTRPRPEIPPLVVEMPRHIQEAPIPALGGQGNQPHPNIQQQNFFMGEGQRQHEPMEAVAPVADHGHQPQHRYVPPGRRGNVGPYHPPYPRDFFQPQVPPAQPVQRGLQNHLAQLFNRDQLIDLVQETYGPTLRPLVHPAYRKPYPDIIDHENPFPRGFKVPEFTLFSGEVGQSTIEHIGCFTIQCGEASGDDNLKLRLFPSSLTGTTLTWYLSLPQNSVYSWKQMEDLFHTQFYCCEPEVSMADLLRLAQKPGESSEAFLARFRRARLKCRVALPEQEFVKLAQNGLDIELQKKFEGMEFQDFYELSYKVARYENLLKEDVQKKVASHGTYYSDPNFDHDVAEVVTDKPVVCLNLVKPTHQPETSMRHYVCEVGKQYTFDVSKASDIFDHLKKTGLIKLPPGHKIPTAVEIGARDYCKFHNSWKHSTDNCLIFRNILQEKIDKGILKFPDKAKETMGVDADPFPAVSVGVNVANIRSVARNRSLPYAQRNLAAEDLRWVLEAQRSRHSRSVRSPRMVKPPLRLPSRQWEKISHPKFPAQNPKTLRRILQRKRAEERKRHQKQVEAEGSSSRRPCQPTKRNMVWVRKEKKEAVTQTLQKEDDQSLASPKVASVIVSPDGVLKATFKAPEQSGNRGSESKEDGTIHFGEFSVNLSCLVLTLPLDDEEEDMAGKIVFEKPEEKMARHIRPLYINAHMDGTPISRVLVDNRAAVNVLPTCMLYKIGKSLDDLVHIEIHSSWCVPSSLHQKLIFWNGGKAKVVSADDKPFSTNTHLVEARYYEEDIGTIRFFGMDRHGKPIGITACNRPSLSKRAVEEVCEEADQGDEITLEELDLAPAKLDDLKAEVQDPLEEINLGSESEPKIWIGNWWNINCQLQKDSDRINSRPDACLQSGYNQIFIVDADVPKTAFRCPSAVGTFEWVMMPFGLKNAGATYQRAMNAIFHDMIGKFMEIYIDDVVVKSNGEADHLVHLRKSFERMRQHGLKMNPLRCAFGVSVGNFLGVLSPLLKLKSEADFKWEEHHQSAFDMIKRYLSRPPVLVPPVKNKPLILYIFAADESMGCLLAQENDKKQEQAVYYLSRCWTQTEVKYSSVEKLCLALFFAAIKLRHYLIYSELYVAAKTDIVKYMLSRPLLRGRIGKWILALSEFNLKYIPKRAVKRQALADFLADHPCLDVEADEEKGINLFSISLVPWKLIFDGSSTETMYGAGVVVISPSELKTQMSFQLDFNCTNNQAEYEALIIGLEMLVEPKVSMVEVIGDSQLVLKQLSGERGNDELLLRCLGPNESFQMLSDVHDGICGAHQARIKMRWLIRRHGFFWPSVLKDCIAYSKGCKSCQIHGPLQRVPASELNSIVKPWPFRGWAIDLIVLPMELTAKSLRVMIQHNLQSGEYDEAMMLELEELEDSRLTALDRLQAQKLKIVKSYNKRPPPSSPVITKAEGFGSYQKWGEDEADLTSNHRSEAFTESLTHRRQVEEDVRGVRRVACTGHISVCRPVHKILAGTSDFDRNGRILTETKFDVVPFRSSVKTGTYRPYRPVRRTFPTTLSFLTVDLFTDGGKNVGLKLKLRLQTICKKEGYLPAEWVTKSALDNSKDLKHYPHLLPFKPSLVTTGLSFFYFSRSSQNQQPISSHILDLLPAALPSLLVCPDLLGGPPGDSSCFTGNC
ncbi:hypothetical protein SLEP1_g42429 [Rubroshorea leprosula]|uniref:Reverse transcriptase n=1 Tax=Rubroshorea leprosula TaxID=152421 RepID=A0AAV5L9R5_9ROSI|nr:hypothetical protein SLEP1_g42429 [Rubroshorea leprosula]